MSRDRTRSFFVGLQRVLLNAPNEELHTPLTEVLELSAVAAGIKSAFVTSDPVYPEEVLASLSTVAAENGLLTCRTRGLPSYGGSGKDRMGVALLPAQLEFLNWREQLDSGERNELWIYSASETSSLIDDAVNGRCSCSLVLDYPTCCTEWHTARFALMEKHQLDRYAAQYDLITGQDYISHYEDAKANRELLEHWRRIEARTDEKLSRQWDASISALPFIGFLACPECTRGDRSPTYEWNLKYRSLAKELDANMCDQIEAIGRQYDRKLDSSCSCGSGRKYRKCCLRQS